MVNSYKTPGVFIEEISKFPPSIAAVETAIPAFIGYTEKHERKGETLELKPTRITSLLEFERFFGGPAEEQALIVKINDQTEGAGDGKVVISREINLGFNANGPSKYLLYYSMQAFFANGGGPCYIVSVGTYQENGTVGKEKMNKGLSAVEREDEPTLIVFPEAQKGLTDPDQFNLINKALLQCDELKDRFVIADMQENASGEGLDPSELGAKIEEFRNNINVKPLKYGAAYFPNLRMVFDYKYKPENVTIEHTENGATAGEFNTSKLSELESKAGGVFNQAKSALGDFPVVIPPSGAIAGIYANVDGTRGVWKAPANTGVTGVVEPTFKVTDDIQDRMNVDAVTGKSINAIRSFPGRGTLVWGSRTFAGNDNEWRYVPVRRFFNMVEESTKKACYQFVFELNDESTWLKVRAMIENFLTLQWNAGALQGSTPEQAFYVRVGLNQTMVPQDILEGRMIVEIGMAVVRPAEFIILRFSHKMPEA